MGAIVDYSFVSTGGAQRFGTVRANFNNSSVVIDETSTTDLGGSTDNVVISAAVSGGLLDLVITNNIGSTISVIAVITLIARK